MKRGITPRTSAKHLKGAAFALLVIATVILFAKFDLRAMIEKALAWMEQLGSWGQVLFVLVYVMTTVLLIPGSALGLSAGALFGVVRGSLLVSLASTLGATCAFLLGRYLARDWVAKKLESRDAFTSMDQAVAKEGWRIVFLARLSPVLPFTLLNYAFGLTRVSLRDYVFASWIGMMPGTVMYVYLGSIARSGLGGQERTPAQWLLYGAGLIATVAVVVVITRIARRALGKRSVSDA